MAGWRGQAASARRHLVPDLSHVDGDSLPNPRTLDPFRDRKPYPAGDEVAHAEHLPQAHAEVDPPRHGHPYPLR
jgi:hypothetical protein